MVFLSCPALVSTLVGEFRRISSHLRKSLPLSALYTVLTILMFTAWHTGQAQQVLRNHIRSAVTNQYGAMVSSLPDTDQLNLSIVLPLRNQTALTSLLSRLYDPSSHDYHRFLTDE